MEFSFIFLSRGGKCEACFTCCHTDPIKHDTLPLTIQINIEFFCTVLSNFCNKILFNGMNVVKNLYLLFGWSCYCSTFTVDGIFGILYKRVECGIFFDRTE